MRGSPPPLMADIKMYFFLTQNFWSWNRTSPASGSITLTAFPATFASTGKQYQSHAATIYKWAQEDAAKEKPKKGIPDYSFKEGESL